MLFDSGPSTADFAWAAADDAATENKRLRKDLLNLEEIVADLQRRVYQLEQLEHRIDDGR